MTIDRNKTPLTHRVTAIAAAYLDGLGCKPVETEVPIRAGWVADLASYWYPTMTEAKRLHVDRRAKELLGVTEWNGELLPRTYGDGPFTVVVEVKTTVSDFKQDRKWNGEHPAHICFLAFPCGIIAKDEMPKGWYGLETSKDGTSLRKVHKIYGWPHPQHTGLVVDFVAAVGIRRDHRTRYAAMKSFLQAYHAKDREKSVQYSAARLLEGVVDWLQHKGWGAERPLVAILPQLGVKTMPKYLREPLLFLESLRKE